MTRDEAIKDIRDNIKPVGGVSLEMAIKALEQQTCEGAVSRQAVKEFVEYIQTIKDKYNDGDLSINYGTICALVIRGWKLVESEDVIKDMPLANPQPKPTVCEDAVSRQAVKDKLLKLCNELEGIFADIRMKEVDDCVCGLCEYDCDHGIDGSAFECPGFETDECFKLADEIRYEWQNTKDLPPVNPQPKTGWIPVSERLPKAFEFVNCTCHSLIDDRENWVVETVYVPQPQDSPYSDWGNIPMLNWGHAEVIAWVHRDIPEPYRAEIEPQERNDEE